MGEPIDMKPIIEALKKELDAGKRFIHIWDGGHQLSAPREIFASPEMHGLLNKYGQPIYNVEQISPKKPNNAIKYPSVSDEVIQELRASDSGDGQNKMFANLSEFVKKYRAGIITPDPRSDASLTEAEKAIHFDFMQFRINKSTGQSELNFQQHLSSLSPVKQNFLRLM